MTDKLNVQGMFAPLGASNHSKHFDRAEQDYYATDPKAVELLLELENFSPNIWECACGSGELSKVLEAHGHNVRSTDLIDRGFGQGGGRFPRADREIRWRYNHKPTLQIRTAICRTRS